jgi:hypothetical protein
MLHDSRTSFFLTESCVEFGKGNVNVTTTLFVTLVLGDLRLGR